MTNRICLEGGTLVTQNAARSILTNTSLWIEHDRIVAVETPPANAHHFKMVSAHGSFVLPGFINGHTHVGMQLFRGLAEEMPLHEWLFNRIFPLERKWVNPDTVKLATELACAEMIHAGTTTFNDMYYYNEVIAATVHKVGMRARVAKTIIEVSGVETSQKIYDDMRSFIDALSPYRPRVIPALAPHSVYGTSQPLMEKTLQAAQEFSVPLHIHLSETEKEEADCQKKFGMSATAYAKNRNS